MQQFPKSVKETVATRYGSSNWLWLSSTWGQSVSFLFKQVNPI